MENIISQFFMKIILLFLNVQAFCKFLFFSKFCASMHMPRLHPSRLVKLYGYWIIVLEFGTDIYFWRIPNRIQTMLTAFRHDGILKSLTYQLNMAIIFYFGIQAMFSFQIPYRRIKTGSGFE